jgi:hypothetical protein
MKTNQLMKYTEKAAVCSEIRKKHSTQSALFKQLVRTAL